jgi:hypothetical protein
MKNKQNISYNISFLNFLSSPGGVYDASRLFVWSMLDGKFRLELHPSIIVFMHKAGIQKLSTSNDFFRN